MNVLVTGGGRGIGRGIVLKAVADGWGCAFTYRENEAAARETCKLARSRRPDAVVNAYRMDVRRPNEVEDTVAQIIEEFGDIHAVVNNAGTVRNAAAVLMDDAEWREVIDTNLSGPFYVTRSLLMHFVSNRHGRIVNISSLAQDGCSGQANYAAAKAGLIGLSRTLAKEYGPKGITANVVTVGVVETDMTRDHMAEPLRKYWLKYCPMQRMGTAEDVAGTVCFLIGPDASFINGEVIRVSGGLTYAP